MFFVIIGARAYIVSTKSLFLFWEPLGTHSEYLVVMGFGLQSETALVLGEVAARTRHTIRLVLHFLLLELFISHQISLVLQFLVYYFLGQFALLLVEDTC